MSKTVFSGIEESLFAINPLNHSHRLTWFTRLIGLIIVMNAIDGLLTIIWVQTNQAVEANPLMATVLTAHPVLFILMKFALVYLGSILLVRFYYKKLAILSLIIAFFVYWTITLYHGLMIFVLM